MSPLFLGEAGGETDHAWVFEPLGQPLRCIDLRHEAGCHPLGDGWLVLLFFSQWVQSRIE